MAFTLAFHRSKSLRYPEVVELAGYAESHEISGELHVVHFREDQVDLLAAIYRLSQGFRSFQSMPDGAGADVFRALLEHGYYVRHEVHGFFPGRKRPAEYVPAYRHIRELISLGRLRDAVGAYYERIDPEPYHEPLHKELLYRKCSS